MSFIWTTPKSKGDIIFKSVISEIRGNTDYLDDNPIACLSNDTTYYLTEFIFQLASDNLAVRNSAYVSQCTGNFHPHCIGQNNGSAP